MMAQGAVELEPYAGRYDYVEFDLSAAGDWPAGLPRQADAVISSLSVHHVNDERKQSLFAEILAHLAPGGWYLNYDPVKPPDPVVEEAWLRAGDRRDPSAEHRRQHMDGRGEAPLREPCPVHDPARAAGRLPAGGGLRGRRRLLEGTGLRHLTAAARPPRPAAEGRA